VQKFAKKINVRAFNPANWWQLEPLKQDGLIHSILLLGGFKRQNNDGEVLVLACSSPVLGCVQPELAGGDTYEKTANVMTSPRVMGRCRKLPRHVLYKCTYVL
jgi:hypothetical protein